MLAAGSIAACGGASAGQAAPAASPGDTFTATAAGFSGRVTLVFTRSGAARVTIALRGALSGTLRGRLVRQPGGIPDVGRSWAIIAAGRVRRLGGAVTARGTVTGTGNIRSGHERLTMTLAGSRRKATLTGRSRTVGPFAGP
jgi:hypothetical protein